MLGINDNTCEPNKKRNTETAWKIITAGVEEVGLELVMMTWVHVGLGTRLRLDDQPGPLFRLMNGMWCLVMGEGWY